MIRKIALVAYFGLSSIAHAEGTGDRVYGGSDHGPGTRAQWIQTYEPGRRPVAPPKPDFEELKKKLQALAAEFPEMKFPTLDLFPSIPDSLNKNMPNWPEIFGNPSLETLRLRFDDYVAPLLSHLDPPNVKELTKKFEDGLTRLEAFLRKPKPEAPKVAKEEPKALKEPKPELFVPGPSTNFKKGTVYQVGEDPKNLWRLGENGNWEEVNKPVYRPDPPAYHYQPCDSYLPRCGSYR